MGPKLMAKRRKPVPSAPRVVGQPQGTKLTQPFREHARGHVRSPARKVAIGQGFVPKLPHDTEQPSTREHVEQLRLVSGPHAATALTSDACSRRLACIGNRMHSKGIDSHEGSCRKVKEPIRKIEMKDGTVRYRLVVDVGHDENGKRQQLTRTFDKLRDARDELSRIRHQTNEGTYVKPSQVIVSEYIDEYLKGATVVGESRPRCRTGMRSARYENGWGGASSSPSARQTSKTLLTGCSQKAVGVAASLAPASAHARYASRWDASRRHSRWL